MFQHLDNWLNYIEKLHPKTIELGLERIKTVAIKLKVLTFSCPIITIGGTNGKGTCLRFLESIYTKAGYTVGSYTSPHLLRFQERVHIHQQELPEQDWIEAFQQVEHARANIDLTFFEFTTLAAFLLFKQAQLDLIILEVGLGGRLDAVNCVDADVAIITTIAMDHMDWLGQTREAIAKEKAGIMRANRPVIIGDINPPAVLTEIAQQLHAQSFTLNKDFQYQLSKFGWQWSFDHTNLEHLPIPKLPLQNAATALMAIECLQAKLSVSKTAIVEGLEKATMPGRFQQFSKPVTTILDVAHNPASAALLAEQLQNKPIKGRTLAVVSILEDKDRIGILKPLLPVISEWYIAGLAVPRGISWQTLAKDLQQLGIVSYHSAESVMEAYLLAVSQCDSFDQIVVFGSFYTVAEVLSDLEKQTV